MMTPPELRRIAHIEKKLKFLRDEQSRAYAEWFELSRALKTLNRTVDSLVSEREILIQGQLVFPRVG